MLRVVLPSLCVFAPAGECCSLFIDHYRPRKTGPGFPVAVVGCTVHPGGRYTLYPPGHLPYGRLAAVPYSPAGTLQQDPATGQPLWPTTLFAAALEAALGGAWPADSPADNDRRRRTQGRRLAWAERLLGLGAGVDAAGQERRATCLRVPTLALLTQAQRPRCTWKARGAAVSAVLGALPVDARLLDRMLAAGALAGLWPPPQRWDGRTHSWVRGDSRAGERAPRQRAHSPPAPPTNWRTPEPAAGV